MRSDIKGGVEHVDVLGADGNMVDLSYLTSSSLFNADLRAIGECGINGTGRNTGIDRNVVLMSDHRQVVRTNLVCHIAVGSHTISTKENGVDLVGSHQQSRSAIHHQMEWNACLFQFKGGQLGSLESGSGLIDIDVEILSMSLDAYQSDEMQFNTINDAESCADVYSG